MNLALHAVGLLAAALWMRPGTAVFSSDVRRAFLAADPLGWRCGWAVWMLCALSVAGFFSVLCASLDAAVARLVTTLVSAAIAVDLLCDVAQLAVLPMAARDTEGVFRVVERLAGAGGTVVANGLYTLAAVTVSVALPSVRVRALGALLGLAGFGMVLAGLMDSAVGVERSTGPAIVLYGLWALVVSRDETVLTHPRAP